MLAAILICGTTMVLTSCSSKEDNPVPSNPEIDKDVMNKKITDGNYDKSLAVKCINGTFVGKKAENIISYKGIPFVGQQPVGNLRWKAPVDVTPSNDVYEAYNYGKTPVQSPGDASVNYGTSENCLYLNIWKADETATQKKPVIVWIYGGGFEVGGTTDPQYDCYNLVKENPDVIFVTLAYRVSFFGFLHLSHLPDGKDYQDAANLGLMDQLMALKWVHENIAGFGGDPENVTIFGESAGAASCTMQPLVPGSQQYFKRLIAESGAVNQTRSTEESIECTNKLMEILGCKTVADLLKVDGEKLLEASAVNFVHQIPERDGRIMPSDPFEAYADGAAKNLEILVGCNKDEMNFFVSSFGKEGWDNWIAQRKSEKIPFLPDEDKARIESFQKDVEGDYYQPDSSLLSQNWFNAPIIKVSEGQAKAGGKCYTYYFTPESPDPVMKCGHAIELAVVFNHPEMTADTGRAFDETFCKTMRKMWVQFAKTGNPSLTAAQSPDGKAKEWPLYDQKDRQVMVLDEFDIHPAKEADVKIVDWERTYPLTKYYML